MYGLGRSVLVWMLLALAGAGCRPESSPPTHSQASPSALRLPERNAMSCSRRPSLNLASGELACYGIRDNGEAFGGNQDMCEDRLRPATGCLVNTAACASGRAIAVEYIRPSSASSAQLAKIAANLGVTTQLLSEEVLTVYVYHCADSVFNNRVVFSHTGADQGWTVPAGVNSLRVKLWGAGGGGPQYANRAAIGGPKYVGGNGHGGGGAFADVALAVTPGETLTVMVGSGGSAGVRGSRAAAYGGGGGARAKYAEGGGGGGRSAIRRGSTELATAGGGGGAAADADGTYGDGGPGGLNGHDGKHGDTIDGTYGKGGRGATVAVGGPGGASGGSKIIGEAGARFKGGDALANSHTSSGGAGGGGYFGGGAGGEGHECGAGGGGGGSSYAPGGTVVGGSGRNAGGMTDADYADGIGMGGRIKAAGGHGRVVIIY